MNLSGYDQRDRRTGRVPYNLSRPATGLVSYAGHAYESSQRTISYRDRIEGRRLEPSEVDPYNGFLARGNPLPEYLNPSAELLSRLESAGLAEPADYEVDGFADNGHPFSTRMYKVGTSLRQTRTFTNTTGERITAGPLFAASAIIPTSKQVFPTSVRNDGVVRLSEPLPMPSTDRLVNDGKLLYTRAAPGRPEVDITQFAAELFGDVPRIPGRALLSMKDIPSGGDEWLNLAFGVIPTIGDGLDIASALSDTTKRLLKLRRHAGTYLRRRVTLPLESNTQIFTNSDLVHPGYIRGGPGYGFDRFPTIGGLGDSTSQNLRAGGTSTDRVTTDVFQSETRDVSFSGSFTYYIPLPSGFLGRLRGYVEEYDRVLGLSLDPTSIWALSPWSWLVDWFFDVRELLDLISVSHDDNLVMNYGYVMETLTRTIVQKSRFQKGYANGGVTFCSSYNTASSKRRLRANPYGFVDQTATVSFDTYRLAILSALGISRLR